MYSIRGSRDRPTTKLRGKSLLERDARSGGSYADLYMSYELGKPEI